MTLRLPWIAAAVAWAVLLFVLSAQHGLTTPDIFLAQDKAAHFLAYAGLGFLLARASYPENNVRGWHVLIIATMAALYGITDEIHQSFVPGRDASVFDWIADTLGGTCAALATYFLHGRRDVILNRKTT